MNTIFKALLKSRFMALSSYMFRHSKTKKKSPLMKVGIVLLALYVIGAVFAMFGYFFLQICEPFHQIGIDWLYFAMAGIMAMVLMFIGSVFMTQTQIYEAKDNEMLLAMPIKASYILMSRMLMLLAFNAAFELLIMIPAIAVYVSKCSVNVLGVIAGIMLLLALPFFALSISCLVGWLLAVISSRVRNKSLITMIFSLAFLAAYFYAYSQMNSYIQKLIANGDIFAHNIKGYVLPLYWFGEAIAEGKISFMLFALLCELVPFIIIYIILSASFIKIATTKRGFAKVRYQEKEMKVETANAALLRKELKHFVSSPMYMLNGALGSVFTIVGGVALIIKKELICNIVEQIPEFSGYIGASVIVALCAIATTNIISAPSISLEGKNLWIIRSMPVSSRNILLSKVKLHLVITLPAMIFTEIVAAAVLDMDWLCRVLVFILPNIVTIFCALFGVVVNLKFPKFDWISETVAIKQSASTMISMFGAFAVILIPGLLYIVLLDGMIAMNLYLLLITVIYAIVCILLYHFLTHKGCIIFEAL